MTGRFIVNHWCHQRSSWCTQEHSGCNQVQSGAFTCTGGAVSMLSSSHSGMDHDIRVAREPSHLYLMTELIRRTQANSGALRRNQAQSVAIRVALRFEPSRSVQRRASRRRRPGREREADEAAVARRQDVVGRPATLASLSAFSRACVHIRQLGVHIRQLGTLNMKDGRLASIQRAFDPSQPEHPHQSIVRCGGCF